MSFALDAIIIFFAIAIIWAAARRGFVHSVMNLISIVASMIVAYVFTPKLGAMICDKIIVPRISDNIFETLKGFAQDIHVLQYEGEKAYFISRLVNERYDDYVKVLERYRVNVGDFVAKVSEFTDSTEDTIRTLAVDIATPTANVISLVIAFLLLFVVSAFVIKGITELLDYIFQLPSLKAANTVLGIVFGVIEAATVACVLALTLSVLADVMGSISPDMFGATVVDKTLICKHLDEIKFFSKIRDVIT